MRYEILLTLLLAASPALAQRHHHTEHGRRHELAFVLAATSSVGAESSQTWFTFGGEYEFRFSARAGIAAEAEYLTGADAGVFAFPAVIHVYRGLMVLAGPGWENRPRHDGGPGGEANFLIRTGVQYSFHIGGRFAVIPSVDFDFVKESPSLDATTHGGEMEEARWDELVVFGVKLGWSF